MSKLLPLLEQISELHPDALLKELATDLKAAIATHGAYRPDTITRAAQHHATHTHTGTARTKPTPTARQTQPRRAPAAATATTARAQSKPAKRTEPLITEISSVSMATKDNGTPDAPGAPASSAEQLRVSGSSAERRDRPLAASIPVSPFSAGTAGAEGGPSFISECLLEACDPDVPTRAAALRTLTRALQNHQQEALEAQEKLVTVRQRECLQSCAVCAVFLCI